MYVRGGDRVFLPIGGTGVAFLDRRDIAAFGHALLLSELATGTFEQAVGRKPNGFAVYATDIRYVISP